MSHIFYSVDFTVAAYIVCGRKVLLVHHRALQSWLPVGGHIELGEDPQTAVLREVKEETGLSVSLQGTVPVRTLSGCRSIVAPTYMDVHEITGEHKHIGMIYFARSDSQQVTLAEAEHSQFGWFTKEELTTLSPPLLDSVAFYAEDALSSITGNGRS